MARASTIALMLICMVALNAVKSESTTFEVGDGKWTFNVENWPNGKSFKAGDILVFNYDPSMHDVVKLDNKAGYDSCSGTGRNFTSGHDMIPLDKGDNYFICSFPGHCEHGMKIAVNAA